MTKSKENELIYNVLMHHIKHYKEVKKNIKQNYQFFQYLKY